MMSTDQPENMIVLTVFTMKTLKMVIFKKPFKQENIISILEKVLEQKIDVNLNLFKWL